MNQYCNCMMIESGIYLFDFNLQLLFVSLHVPQIIHSRVERLYAEQKDMCVCVVLLSCLSASF